MVMRSSSKAIPPALQKTPFSSQQAKTYGLSRHYLRKMTEEGLIENIARGIYRVTQTDYSEEDQFRSAMIRLQQPAAICLVSALSFHHLIDAIPNKTWVMVPYNKKTKYSDLKLLRVRTPLWKIGIIPSDGYKITSLERSIVDAFVYKHLIGAQIGIEALKTSVRLKKTTLGKILDMAKTLKADQRVRPYIEALS